MTGQQHIDLVEKCAAHNYHPLPIVVAKADGVWVEDVDGKRYMDMLAAYSAVNFGHSNPELIAAAKEQLEKVTLTSRAFHNDQLGPFAAALADLCGMEAILPMNTGAEAVETAVKTARKWGYMKKGVRDGKATAGFDGFSDVRCRGALRLRRAGIYILQDSSAEMAG